MDVATLLRLDEQIRREQHTLLKSRGVKIHPPDPNKLPDPPIDDHGLLFHALHDHVCNRACKEKRIPTPKIGGFVEMPFDTWKKRMPKGKQDPAAPLPFSGIVDREESACTTASPMPSYLSLSCLAPSSTLSAKELSSLKPGSKLSASSPELRPRQSLKAAAGHLVTSKEKRVRRQLEAPLTMGR